MEYFKFYDHMAHNHWTTIEALKEGNIPTIAISGTVLHEDNDCVVLGVAECTWYDGSQEYNNTWYIVKGAIIERREIILK
jgi:uncharacterized protein YodC (DUF2158 family)